MLTHRRQQQVIADLIHGIESDIDLEQLEEPYEQIFKWVEGYDSQTAYQHLIRLKMQDETLAGVIDGILACEPGERREFPSLKAMGANMPQSTWFWEGWIPRGMMTLLAAWPGIGKTYVAQYLAHCITDGQPAPDGQALDIRTGNVIYVDAEGFLPDLYERGMAWGMNMDKIFPMVHPPRELLDMNDHKYQDDLIDMCYEMRPDLVVIDSLSSVNARGENNIEDIRQILNFFLELAGAFDLAEILVHHLRKPSGGSTRPVSMHDLRGSGHLSAMARAFLGLDILNPSDPNGPRVLKLLKKNRGKIRKPISIQFSDAPGNPNVAALSFGQLDIFEQPESKTDQCAEWLVETLSEGEQAWGDLLEMGKEAGYARMTILRARENLGNFIIDTLGARLANNKWALNPDLNEIYEESESQEGAESQS